MRKKIAAISLVIIIIAVIILAFYKIKSNKNSYYTKTFSSMDTAVSVTFFGEPFDDELYSNIKKRINELNNIFDAYSENGEIYKLNKNKNLSCSFDSVDIISKTLSLQKEYKNVDISSGELIYLWGIQSENPKVPSKEKINNALKTINAGNIHINDNVVSVNNDTKIDLGACAKGYACDIIKQELKNSNADCAIISFGSSTLLYGEKPNNEEFSVAVRAPKKDDESYVGKLKTKCCTISSSGGYERYFEANGKTYSHILDLKTGYPADTDLTSVTVISQNGLLTDFLSTEIYIGGTKNINNYLNNEDYSVIAISDDNKIYISDKLKDNFEVTDYKYSFEQ